jgi:catalase
MVPLVVAPYGGKLPDGTVVQRTLAATRSVEFDAVLLAGSPAPAADALVVRDSKAGENGANQLDPRVQLLLQECFRHAKAIGAWGDGTSALELVGLAGAAGVFGGDDPAAVFAEVQTALGAHRVWERFGTALS